MRSPLTYYYIIIDTINIIIIIIIINNNDIIIIIIIMMMIIIIIIIIITAGSARAIKMVGERKATSTDLFDIVTSRIDDMCCVCANCIQPFKSATPPPG